MPKGRDVLREEVVSADGLNIADIEDNKELIDKAVERLFKEEEFKASEKNKTAKAREEMERVKGRKEFYKGEFLKGSKPKGDETKGSEISPEDKSYLFGRMRMTRTEVRHLEKVMKITGKPWNKALEDNLYTSWEKDNDALITRRGSGLPASRGGVSGKEKTEHGKMVEKFTNKLPKEFAPPK